WAKRVCRSSSTRRHGVPRLGVAGFGSRVGFGDRWRLGVEVAHLGAGFGGALGGEGRRATPRRGDGRLGMEGMVFG
ncbi:hypothetical protein PIB30_094715, partial [Stylosanthes scabra]|nr:hypothetical protein [Stylosanthes scabra]